jgi:hypothetical protein
MTAFNMVRFRVKPGSEQDFVEAHRRMRPELRGFMGGSLVKTGDRTFCFIGEWRNFQSIVNARPQMVSMLDQVRHMLEDLGNQLGVTDPVSGDSVLRLGVPRPATRKRATKRSTPKRKAGRKTSAKRKSGKSAAKKSARKRAK